MDGQRAEGENAGLVRRFYESFEDQRLDDFVDVLHPEVELQTARGIRIGLTEARDWALKAVTGELDQRFVVEELIESGDHVLALVRKQWWWREHDDLAGEDPVAALFSFRDGRIARWQPFVDRAEGYAAAGIDPAAT